MIRAIIIDDESKARQLLHTLLKECPTPITIVEECEDLPNGVKAIRKHKPDLVFLDVEMPRHTGLDIVDFFDKNEMQFGIIFTTAYNQYAINAIKIDAIDYILKPIDPDELYTAVEKFNTKWKKNTVTKQATVNRIAVPSGQSIKLLAPDEILYLEAENVYTVIHFVQQEKLLVSRTLKNFEETLAEYNEFIRCHKSFIVNKKHIKDYVKSEGGYLVLSNNIKIPVTGDKVDEILADITFVKR